MAQRASCAVPDCAWADLISMMSPCLYSGCVPAVGRLRLRLVQGRRGGGTHGQSLATPSIRAAWMRWGETLLRAQMFRSHGRVARKSAAGDRARVAVLCASVGSLVGADRAGDPREKRLQQDLRCQERSEQIFG